MTTGLRPSGRSWHTVMVPDAELTRFLERIRHMGGVITSSRPAAGFHHVTYTA